MDSQFWATELHTIYFRGMNDSEWFLPIGVILNPPDSTAPSMHSYKHLQHTGASVPHSTLMMTSASIHSQSEWANNVKNRCIHRHKSAEKLRTRIHCFKEEEIIYLLRSMAGWRVVIDGKAADTASHRRWMVSKWQLSFVPIFFH